MPDTILRYEFVQFSVYFTRKAFSESFEAVCLNNANTDYDEANSKTVENIVFDKS